MRADLLAQARGLLARAGYCLSQDSALRPLSFDIVARRDAQLLLVKVLTNVEGMGAMVDVAMRLEDYLQEALALPSDPFSSAPPSSAPALDDITQPPASLGEGFEGAMLRQMAELGFRVVPTAKSPFSAISKD